MEGLTSGETTRSAVEIEEHAEVGVQDLLPEEEGHDRSEGQERPERNRHRAGLRTVASEQDDCGEQGREHADHEADHDVASKAGAEQERELDVAHSHALGVDDERHEEKERSAEAGRHPLECLVGRERDLGCEDDHCRGQHDQVGQDPPLGIDRRKSDEDSAEKRADEGLA